MHGKHKSAVSKTSYRFPDNPQYYYRSLGSHFSWILIKEAIFIWSLGKNNYIRKPHTSRSGWKLSIWHLHVTPWVWYFNMSMTSMLTPLCVCECCFFFRLEHASTFLTYQEHDLSYPLKLGRKTPLLHSRVSLCWPTMDLNTGFSWVMPHFSSFFIKQAIPICYRIIYMWCFLRLCTPWEVGPGREFISVPPLAHFPLCFSSMLAMNAWQI